MRTKSLQSYKISNILLAVRGKKLQSKDQTLCSTNTHTLLAFGFS